MQSTSPFKNDLSNFFFNNSIILLAHVSLYQSWRKDYIEQPQITITIWTLIIKLHCITHHKQYIKPRYQKYTHQLTKAQRPLYLCRKRPFYFPTLTQSQTLYYFQFLTLQKKKLTNFSISLNLNHLSFTFLHFLLRYSNNQHTIFHISLNLINLSILRELKPSLKFATTPFNMMPLVIFLIIFIHIFTPFTTNLKHFSSISTFTSSFFNPGRSDIKTCASLVSFQSVGMLRTGHLFTIDKKGS